MEKTLLKKIIDITRQELVKVDIKLIGLFS